MLYSRKLCTLLLESFKIGGLEVHVSTAFSVLVCLMQHGTRHYSALVFDEPFRLRSGCFRYVVLKEVVYALVKQF